MLVFFFCILSCDAVSLSSVRALPATANEALKVVGAGDATNLNAVNAKRWDYGKKYANHDEVNQWSSSNYVTRNKLNGKQSRKTGDVDFNLAQSGKLDSTGVMSKLSHSKLFTHSNLTTHVDTVASPKKLNSLNRTTNFDVEMELKTKKESANSNLDDTNNANVLVDVTSVQNNTVRKGGRAVDDGRKLTHTITGGRDFSYSKGSDAEWTAAEAAGHDLYVAQDNDGDWDLEKAKTIVNGGADVPDGKPVALSVLSNGEGGFGKSDNLEGRPIDYGRDVATGLDGADGAGSHKYDISILDYLRNQMKITAPLCTDTIVGTGQVVKQEDGTTPADATPGTNYVTGVAVWEGTKGCRYECCDGATEGAIVKAIAQPGDGVCTGAVSVVSAQVSAGCTSTNGLQPMTVIAQEAAAPCGKCTHFSKA